MKREELELLAQQVAQGSLSVDSFVSSLLAPGIAELGQATLDLDRKRRCGFHEVIFGEGKSTETLAQIFDRLLHEHLEVLATRVAPDKAEPLCKQFPQACYNKIARTFRVSPNQNCGTEQGKSDGKKIGNVAVVTAGTSDSPVAEEAKETLDWMGIGTTMIYDVGVA